MERVTFGNIAMLGLLFVFVPSGGGCHGKEFQFASSETAAPQNEHPLHKSGGQLQGDSLLKVDKQLIKEEEIAQNKAASRILHLKALAPNKMSIERWKISGWRHLQLPGNGRVRVLDLTVQTETTLRISCDVTGSPQPGMVWYLPSRENITAGSNGSDVRMSVQHDGVLQIRDFSMADTGLFICADTIVPDRVYVVAQVDAYSVKIILAVAAGFVVFSMLAGSCVLCKYLQYKKSMALIPEEERRKPKSFDSW